MAEKNVTLDFRIKKIDETINYLLGGIKHNESMIEKHKNY